MPNDRTYFRFIVPAKVTQVQWLFRLHDATWRLLRADAPDRVASKIQAWDPEILAPAQLLAKQFAEQDCVGPAFEYQPDNGGVCLFSPDGFSNLKYAATLARYFLWNFTLDHVIRVRWNTIATETGPHGYEEGTGTITRHRITLLCRDRNIPGRTC